jgi:hypothetical protein
MNGSSAKVCVGLTDKVRFRHSSDGGHDWRDGIAFVNDRFATAFGGGLKGRH